MNPIGRGLAVSIRTIFMPQRYNKNKSSGVEPEAKIYCRASVYLLIMFKQKGH